MCKLVHGKTNHITKAEFYEFRNLGVSKYIILTKRCFKFINCITLDQYFFILIKENNF